MNTNETNLIKKIKRTLRRKFNCSTSPGSFIFGQIVMSPIKDTRYSYGNHPSVKVRYNFDIHAALNSKDPHMDITFTSFSNANCESADEWNNHDWKHEDETRISIRIPFEEFEQLYLLAKESNDRYAEFRKQEKNYR